MQALALALLLAAAPPPAGRDFYFEQTTQSFEDGQAQGPGILSRVWFSGKKMRLEAGAKPSPVLILKIDEGVALRLDPAQKVAVSIPMDDLRSRTQLDHSAAGEVIGGAEEGSARTHPLEGTKVIAGQTCEGYRIRSGTGTIDVYVARAVPLGVGAFADFLEWSGAHQAMGGIISELRRLPGFPMEIRTHASVLGHTQDGISTVNVLRVGSVDPSLFAAPKDYELVTETKEP